MNGFFSVFDVPSAIDTSARGINDAQQIVGVYRDSLSRQHGFLLSGGAFAIPQMGGIYTILDDPLATEGTRALGINDTGQIVGLYSDASGTHSFLYSGGFYTTLDDPFAGVSGTIVTGINNAGAIVGFYTDSNGTKHGFLTPDGGFHYTNIDDPLGTGGSQVTGTSYDAAKGLIYNVGNYFDSAGREHGFFNDFYSGTFITLDGPPGSIGTHPNGVDSAGRIVGTYTTSGGHELPFLYIGGDYLVLPSPNPVFAVATVAQGIGEDKAAVGVEPLVTVAPMQIVGFYVESNGTEHGFLFTVGGGSTANMILRASNTSSSVGQASNTSSIAGEASNTSSIAGQYEIYDIGNNAILGANLLGQVGTDWQFAGLGSFNGAGSTDMLLRNSSTGGFEVYDISNNNVASSAFLGTVGSDWQPMGFGDFASLGENDMILRNVNTGGVEVYDINNNQITGANFMGTVGPNWQFSGVGNFSGRGTSGMLLRDSNTGGLEAYDIANNQITGAAFIGTVGVDWQFSGVGNFSGVPGETGLLLRNVNTGGLELYDISNNQLTGAAFIGTVGSDWQFAGVAPIHAPGASDLVLRNVNTGAFEVYDIANNQLIGAASLGSVGLDWQVGGLKSNTQLVQAMAGFGGSGAAANLNTAPLSAETSQQPLLASPQHA
jgi:probable HAF family extracellular repeat protein